MVNSPPVLGVEGVFLANFPLLRDIGMGFIGGVDNFPPPGDLRWYLK